MVQVANIVNNDCDEKPNFHGEPKNKNDDAIIIVTFAVLLSFSEKHDEIVKVKNSNDTYTLEEAIEEASECSNSLCTKKVNVRLIDIWLFFNFQRSESVKQS